MSSYTFPPTLVPAIQNLWDRIDRAVSQRLWEMSELNPDETALSDVDPEPVPQMSGSYGTVYPTNAPGWVVKVSCDPTEGPVAQAIRSEELLESHPGVVDIAGVWVAPQTSVPFEGEQLPFFVILRESINPLEIPFDLVEDLERGEGPPDIQALWNVRNAATWYNEARSEFDRLHYNDRLEEHLEELESFRHAAHLADFMGLFKDTFGGAIADAHPGNLGTRSGEDDWVLFDVGHSANVPGPPIAFLPNPLVIPYL